MEWKWSSNNALMERHFWTSAYLIGDMMIDCSAPDSEDEMHDFLNNLPVNRYSTKCCLTHSHEDHAGCGWLFTNKLGIPVYAPKESIKTLEVGWEYGNYRKFSWGQNGFRPFTAKPLPVKIEANSGEYSFSTLKMPGHAKDLTAYIEKEAQWAFVGDMMLPKYQQIFGKTCEFKEDIKTIYDSLSALYDFTEGMDNLKIFVSGQGVYNGRDVILERRQEIKDLHKKVHHLDKELGSEMKVKRKMRKILRDIFGGESMFATITNGELSRENLILSLLKWGLD